MITLGSPFGGSPWAVCCRLSRSSGRCGQASPPSASGLSLTSLPDGVRRLLVAANLDVIVPGLRSVPFHPQVETITVNGVGHLGMLLSRRVIECIMPGSRADSTATAAEPAPQLSRNRRSTSHEGAGPPLL